MVYLSFRVALAINTKAVLFEQLQPIVNGQAKGPEGEKPTLRLILAGSGL
ncbi:hypothetical protein [Sphingopyxis sp. BSNA05]|nr:hypothetical protein [Sphingopyxis sp. BSNA05]